MTPAVLYIWMCCNLIPIKEMPSLQLIAKQKISFFATNILNLRS